MTATASALPMLGPEAGLLLVGHGTRDPRGTAEFFDLARRLATQIAPVPSAACLLEFQEPTIAQAWRSLSEHGVHHIRVAPLLLFAAGHAKEDIPAAIDEVARSTPGVTFDHAPPISRQAMMVDLVVKRIEQSLTSRQQPCCTDRTAVVLVGRGNRDVCAQADMRVLTEIVAHRLVGIDFFTTFYAMAQPRLPDTLRQIAQGRDYDHVVIQPHLLFNGRLYEAIDRQVAETRDCFPDIEWILSDYLGPVDAVAQAIARRARVVV